VTTVTSNQTKTGSHSLNPEDYGDGLAHIILVNQGAGKTRADGDIQVLGQAWLAGRGKLITCGHVVAPYVSDYSRLELRFPQSGNRYTINEIRLHPSYNTDAQANQLIKFDAALILVNLSGPEADARPLPIAFGRNLPSQLPLTAVRYPTHLGQFGAALNPLAQMGHLLGPLRKDDSYHLLHDLALAPGDSGSAIFDAYTVVALHCGDTATLPGLNLPTTSIRLCLWIDALKDLGIEPNAVVEEVVDQPSPLPATLAFILAFVLAFSGLAYFLANPIVEAHPIDKPVLQPVVVQFNKPKNGYQFKEPAKISLIPGSDCHLYMFEELPPGTIMMKQEIKFLRAYPPENLTDMATTKANTPRYVETIGPFPIKVDANSNKLHIFVLNSALPRVELASSFNNDKPQEQEADFKKLLVVEEKNPGDVMHIVMDSPTSDPKLGVYSVEAKGNQ
jgi:Trypsin-like peptidase domain